MISFSFKDYAEFKELFVREDGRRKNAVLLAFLKSRTIREYLKENYPRGLFTINSMQKLRQFCDGEIRATGQGRCEVIVDGVRWRNSTYHSDNQVGICEDRDYSAYRYVNSNDGRVYKKKFGRLFKEIIQCSSFGSLLPEAVVLWLCEEHQREWETYARSKLPKDLTLVVDDDFEKIYSHSKLKGEFHSCMTGRGHHYFYSNSVKAKAAYLEDADGLIRARCIIFTEVKDVNDPNVTLRLAERQYSTDSSELLKRDLVRELIAGGHIDGYKRVGADCHSPTSWLSTTDEDWSHRRFYIDCKLEDGDTLSYQDTFKYFCTDEQKAYNYGHPGWNFGLDTTEDEFNEDGENYDEYHDRYTRNDTVDVFYNGSWISCDEDELEDFYYVDGEGWVHYEDSFECAQCGDRAMNRDAYYSEITEEDYCCESCRDQAEREYKESNWYYSEYDDKYYEDEDDVTRYINESGDAVSISVDSADSLVSSGELICVGGNYYNTEWATKILEENA